MEVAVLGGLVGLGYAISSVFDKNKTGAATPVVQKRVNGFAPKGYLAPMNIGNFTNGPIEGFTPAAVDLIQIP